jgi:hypothetical protein
MRVEKKNCVDFDTNQKNAKKCLWQTNKRNKNVTLHQHHCSPRKISSTCYSTMSVNQETPSNTSKENSQPTLSLNKSEQNGLFNMYFNYKNGKLQSDSVNNGENKPKGNLRAWATKPRTKYTARYISKENSKSFSSASYERPSSNSNSLNRVKKSKSLTPKKVTFLFEEEANGTKKNSTQSQIKNSSAVDNKESSNIMDAKESTIIQNNHAIEQKTLDSLNIVKYQLEEAQKLKQQLEEKYKKLEMENKRLRDALTHEHVDGQNSVDLKAHLEKEKNNRALLQKYIQQLELEVEQRKKVASQSTQICPSLTSKSFGGFMFYALFGLVVTVVTSLITSYGSIDDTGPILMVN